MRPPRPARSVSTGAARRHGQTSRPARTASAEPSQGFESAAVQALLQGTVEEAARLLGADGGMIYLADPEGGTLRLSHDAGITDRSGGAWARGLRLPMGAGMFGRAVAEGRVQQTGDYAADASFPHAPQADRVVAEAGIRSMVVAPLVSEGVALGALGVFASRPDAFRENDAVLVRALADHAAITVTNGRLIDALARSREELAGRAETERALREIGQHLASIRESGDLLQRVVTEAGRLVGAEGTILVLLGPDDLLHWSYDDGLRQRFDPAYVAGLTLEIGVGVTGRAVAERRVVICNEDLIDAFPRTPESEHFFEVSGFRSMIGAPISGEAGPLGALEVYSTHEGAFDEADAALIATFADQAAIALTNARLIEELGRSREQVTRRAERERSLRELVSGLVAIRDTDVLLQRTVDAAANLAGADGALLGRMLPGGGVGPGFASSRAVGRAGALLDSNVVGAGEGMMGLAASQRRVLATDDYLADERFVHLPASDELSRELGMRSFVAAPLIAEEEVLGILGVHSTRPAAFDADDIALIAAFADQAAVAMTNARLIEELGRSRAELARRAEAERSLREIAAQLVAIRDPRDLLQSAVEAAARLAGADWAEIAMVEPDGRLRWAYDAGIEGETLRRALHALDLRVGQGVLGRAAAERRPVVTGDYLVDDRFDHQPATDSFARRVGFRSLVAAPLVTEAGVVGVLGVHSSRPDAFDTDDVALIAAFAHQAAVAMANADLIGELDRSRTQLGRRAAAEHALGEIVAGLAAIRDPAQLLQQAVDAAARLVGADGAVIDAVDPEGRIRSGFYAPVLDPAVLDRVRNLDLRVGEGLFGRAAAERRVIVVDDYLGAGVVPAVPGSEDLVRSLELRSLVVAPLAGESGVVGVLAVYSRRASAFDADDVALITAFADQAAVAMTNARLIEALDRSRGELARRVESERTLREIGARITSLRDPGEVLQQVVDETRRLLGSDGAHLTLLDDGGRDLVPAVVAGGDDAIRAWLKTQRFPLDGGINGLAASRGEPVWTADYLLDPRIPHEPDDQDVAARLGLRAVAVAPLRAPEEGVLGTLAVSYSEAREITPEAIEQLSGMADQAAIVVGNIRLYDRLRESEARYRYLVDNSPDLIWSIDAEGRLVLLSETSERLTGWRADELLGQHFSVLVHPDSSEVAVRDWFAETEGPLREVRSRFDLRHRDGTAIPVEFRGILAAEDGRFAWGHGSVRDIREQDRLERELRASEERYRYLVENSPDIVFSVDPEGRFTYLSETVERVLGWRAGDLVGQHFRTIIDTGSMEAALGRWADLQASPGTVLSARFDLINRDGSRAPFEIRSAGLIVDGRFAGVQGAARGISEQVRLERELGASEERYRSLVQTSPDGVWGADAEGRFTFWSETATSLYGWTSEDVVGRHWSAVVTEDTLPAAEAAWQALADGADTVVRVPIVLRHRDGREIPSEVSAVPVFGGGAFGGAHGSVRDVSERERLERELRESEAQYRYLVDNSPDIVWSADAEGIFTYVSETSEPVLGWPPDELVGSHFAAVIHPESREYVAGQWATAAAAATELELRYRFVAAHRDGSRVPVEMHARTRVEEGRYLGAHGAVRDLRERERLERDLRRQAGELAASEERAHLARELHDSVTQALFSMTLVTRSIELLMARDPEAATARLETLRELQRDALAEMRALIFELRPASLETEGLVPALRTHAAAVQGRTGLPVVIEADEQERFAPEVETALFRIAQEALHNVVKHAGARQVRMALERRPDRLWLTIEDDGGGFDPGAVPGGHLGLAGMRARAEKLGGRLAVESAAGQGTRIRVWLPLEGHPLELTGATPAAVTRDRDQAVPLD